jgi:hypothetical protein
MTSQVGNAASDANQTTVRTVDAVHLSKGAMAAAG